jgi:preprotein translocase subunit SecB
MSARFQPLEISFETLQFQRLPSPRPNHSFELDQRLNLGHVVQDNILVVRLGMDLGQDGLPFTLSVAVVGRFQFQELPVGAELEKIANINCAGILFPFVREAVADLTRKGGLNPVLLPPVNFVELFRQNQSDQSGQDSSANSNP